MIESLVPEKVERPQPLLQLQIQFPPSVTYVPNCAPQESDSTVTFQLIN